MERLFTQGVVARGYGKFGQSEGKWKLHSLTGNGLRPKIVIGQGKMAVKGFNARGVAIVTTNETEAVRTKLEALANEAVAKGGQLGKRQQILDDWIVDTEIRRQDDGG